MSNKMLSRMQKVELLKEIAANPSIPSPPTVVLQVLEKASLPECTIQELCKIIQVDPGLAGRILRIVNSATFGLSRPVTSIQRALAVVGLNAARLLVLSISFPEMQVPQKPASSIRPWQQGYWRTSVGGAIVARELSVWKGSRDPDDDMAAALLRDLGELILLQLFPEGYQKVLAEPRDALVHRQCELENNHCGLDHAEVSAFILDRWRLPPEVTEAVHHHHKPEQVVFSSPKAKERAHVLHFAMLASQLLQHQNQPKVLQRLRDWANRHYKMDEPTLTEFLKPLTKKISDFAALLQVDIGQSSDFESILTRASDELVSLTVTTNLDSQRATEKIAQAPNPSALPWKQEAVFDPLTKVFNRRFLENKLLELFERPKNTQDAFALLFLDLDGFKPLNDKFGHPFGDLVLQKVADCINRQVRQGDVVARYGGDEFCILSHSIDDQGVQALCKRVLQAICDLTVVVGTNEGKVGVSIGAVQSFSTAPWESHESLLVAADKAMYQAKAQGKNRIVFWQENAATSDRFHRLT